MQQTRLDRWLKDTFVLETHLLTLSEPPYVPRGVKLEEQELNLKNRFKFRMIIRSRKELELAIQALTDANQTFTTKVLSRQTPLRNLFDNPLGKSFTWRVIGWCTTLSLAYLAIRHIPWDQAYRLGEAFDFLRQYM